MNLIGTRIGSYVVERELGSGGAGTVYACRHTMIDREVAVKVLHDEHARDADQVARFFQEAKAAAEIGHPNIIVIIDYGTLEHEGVTRTYVMMESLVGESLDKRLARGGMSLDDIHHVLGQIASALIACHGKGIIHRDLKPSNVFLCPMSFDPLFVKLLDFGTAKLAAPEPGVRRTQYGVVIGTPAYMSPEQCEGKGAIDHRSDIYSLGVMVYEMLTGTLPFGGGVGEILLSHLTRTPEPPRQRNPSIPAEWEALCLRMMEKSRDDRFQSVVQLAHALEDLRGYAASYQAAQRERSASGHSGHTMQIDGRTDDRATLRVDVGDVLPGPAPAPPAHPAPPTTGPHPAPLAHPGPPTTGPHAAPRSIAAFAPVPAAPQPGPTAPPSGGFPAATPPPITYASFDPRHGCAALVEDPRHAAFSRTLMARPLGRWFEVTELCATARVAMPAALPPDLSLFVSWLEHPYPDPSLAAVVFLSLRTGWSTVVLCGRAR